MTDAERSVSLPPLDMATCVQQTAALIGLPIPSDCQPGVVGNLTRTAAIAQLVLEFPLPPEIEIATRFEP